MTNTSGKVRGVSDIIGPRLCGYCSTWHYRPCGIGCYLQIADPTWNELLARTARDTDRSGEADETAQQAQPEARAGAEGIAQDIPPPPTNGDGNGG